jgi:hypothetical protein
MLDVLCLERLFKQRVFEQIDHAHGEVVTGPPVGMCLAQFFVGERLSLGGYGYNHG